MSMEYPPQSDFELHDYEDTAPKGRFEDRPELQAGPADEKLIRGLVIGFIAFSLFMILIIGLLFYFSAEPGATQTIRDISIILLAVVNLFIAIILMVLTVVLAYLVLKTNDLIQLITTEMKPFLESANQMAYNANDTVRTVQSRVTVVSDEAVRPIMKTVSTFSAAKAIFISVFRK